jgi:cyclophilin family peptidyl-prolyl cis-trans isomerase
MDPQQPAKPSSSRLANVIALLALTVAAATGCGGESENKSAAPGEITQSNTTIPTSPAKPKQLDRVHPVVLIDTNAGAITLRLDAEKAPGTVRNFLNYANEGFYDNTLVHYVDAEKMIVGGGYAADRTLKPTRQAIRNEAHNGLKNTAGTIAMARDATRIDSATSQFFINLSDAPQRDHKGDDSATYGYCVFGEVIEGLEVARRISEAPTANRGSDLSQTPDPAVIVKSIRVIR